MTNYVFRITQAETCFKKIETERKFLTKPRISQPPFKLIKHGAENQTDNFLESSLTFLKMILRSMISLIFAPPTGYSVSFSSNIWFMNLAPPAS